MAGPGSLESFLRHFVLSRGSSEMETNGLSTAVALLSFAASAVDAEEQGRTALAACPAVGHEERDGMRGVALIRGLWKGLETKDVHRGKVLNVGNMNDWQSKSPLEWKTYVNKMVKVVAVEKHEYEGWVLTVDPISASIILATYLENEKVSISVVLGPAIQKVEILKEGDDEMKQRLSSIFAPQESKAYSPEELEERKNCLKTWLEANHIPVTEQGESGKTLCVAGVLTIDPPYSPEECSSSNEIILSRVQGLIQGYLEKQQ